MAVYKVLPAMEQQSHKMFRTAFDKENKQWNGPKIDPIFNPNTSLGNVILNILQMNGSRIAQVSTKLNLDII